MTQYDSIRAYSDQRRTFFPSRFVRIRAYSHQRRAFFSAAEILLRIYQNPMHLNGARWWTTFFCRRTSRCLQKKRTSLVWIGSGLFTPVNRLRPIHTKDVRFFCCGNSAADISKPHTFKWDPLADEVLEAAWSSPTEKRRPPTCPI